MRFWQRSMRGKSYDTGFAANQGLTPAGVVFGRVTECTPGVHCTCRRARLLGRFNSRGVAQWEGAGRHLGPGRFVHLSEAVICPTCLRGFDRWRSLSCMSTYTAGQWMSRVTWRASSCSSRVVDLASAFGQHFALDGQARQASFRARYLVLPCSVGPGSGQSSSAGTASDLVPRGSGIGRLEDLP